MDTPRGGAAGPWTATDAANYAFDRLFEELRVEPATGGPARPAARPGRPRELSEQRLRARSTAARVVDVYADLFHELFRSLATDVTDGLLGPGEQRASGQPIAIAGHPGSSAGAVIWIHNTAESYVPALTLRLTDLWHSDGSRLAAALGSIEPSRFAGSVESRRAAWVAVQIPADAHLGTYHGHILADGLPDTALPVSVFVR